MNNFINKHKLMINFNLQENSKVYVTNYGEKYHMSHCEHLKKSKKEITLQQAIMRNKTACRVCCLEGNSQNKIHIYNNPNAKNEKPIEKIKNTKQVQIYKNNNPYLNSNSQIDISYFEDIHQNNHEANDSLLELVSEIQEKIEIDKENYYLKFVNAIKRKLDEIYINTKIYFPNNSKIYKVEKLKNGKNYQLVIRSSAANDYLNGYFDFLGDNKLSLDNRKIIYYRIMTKSNSRVGFCVHKFFSEERDIILVGKKEKDLIDGEELDILESKYYTMENKVEECIFYVGIDILNKQLLCLKENSEDIPKTLKLNIDHINSYMIQPTIRILKQDEFVII